MMDPLVVEKFKLATEDLDLSRAQKVELMNFYADEYDLIKDIPQPMFTFLVRDYWKRHMKNGPAAS